MTTQRRTWRSGAHSRWHGARTRLVPHWTPPPRPAPRSIAEIVRDIGLEPPTTNGSHEAQREDGEPDGSSPP